MSIERSKFDVERSASTASVDADNPWPGLESFTEDARSFFFGREKETDELSRLVRRQTLTVLFGQSGLGKSSLLKAGLFPILREADFLPLYLRLDHAAATPPLADQVKAALVEAFAAIRADAPVPRPDETLWEYFHRKDIDIWSVKNRLLTPVLAFDQFEEIFTLGRADTVCRERSREFLAELACLVENRPPAAVKAKLDAGTLDPARFNFEKPSCQVILSLREDFLPDLEGLKQEMPALIHNRLRLKKLNGTQALEVVTRPAPQLLAEGVAERIVEFVAGARGGSAERLAELDVEPPLLSVICRELNERRRANGAAQITADLVSGNRREILTDFYERSVGDLPEAMRTFVEDHLLTKSGFRDNLALEGALEFPGVTRPLLDTLVARRLLRIEDRLGMQRVELTHDVLAEVIRGSRDARQQRLQLAADRRRSRRQRWVIAGLALVVVGLLAGAVFGIRAQRNSAAQAGQTDVLLASRLLDEDKLKEGIAQLVRAGRKDPANPLVAPRLLSAITAHRFLMPVAAPLSLPSPAIGGTFSTDGRWLGIQSEDLSVRIIDTATWTVAREYTFAQKVRRGGVKGASLDNTVLAALLVDGSIVIFDRATGQPRGEPIHPPSPVLFSNSATNFRLSPDGRWLAAGGRGNVWVWDARTGDLRTTLPGQANFAFSPDSRLIATCRDLKSTLWSLPDQAFVGQPFECAPSPNGSGVWDYDFSADSRLLLIRHWNGSTLCDTSTGLPVAPMVAQQNYRVDQTWISSDGTKLVWSHGQVVEVLDAATGSPVYPSLKHSGTVRETRLVDGGRILFTTCVDGSVRLWDLATGQLLVEPTIRQTRYTPAAISDDGKTVVLFPTDGRVFPLRVGGRPAGALTLARDRDTTFRVNLLPDLPNRISWLAPTSRKAIDVASGQVVAGGFPYPENPVNIHIDTYTATIGPGEVLVAQLPSNELRIWTLGENGVVNDVPLADPPAYTGNSIMAFAPSLQRVAWPLATGGDPNHNRLGIWDTQSGRRVATIDAGSNIAPNNWIPFSADGKRVVFKTTPDQIVHVCDVGTGKDVFTVKPVEASAILVFRYTPDGRRLLTGDDEGGIQVWDAETGAMLRSSHYHRAAVTRFEHSPDNRFYASSAADGTAQVWDAATDEPVGALMEENRSGARPNFSRDGTRIAISSNSGRARVWDVQSGLPLTELRRSDDEDVGLSTFTPDGRFVVLNPGSGAAQRRYMRVMAVPPVPAGRTPDWLLTLATICAGSRLTDDGKLVGAIEEFAKIADVQRALAALPANDPYAEWGRWILSDSSTRSIGPGFTITPAEATERARETPSVDGW